MLPWIQRKERSELKKRCEIMRDPEIEFNIKKWIANEKQLIAMRTQIHQKLPFMHRKDYVLQEIGAQLKEIRKLIIIGLRLLKTS